MRAVLDACVLFPTVLREILLGSARAGLFVPYWSERILAEWRGAAGRIGPDADAVAGAEIALLQAQMPDARVIPVQDGAIALDLPDPADRHVIEAAMAADAPVIVTANLRDFPRRPLATLGIQAIHPDEFLRDLYLTCPAAITAAVEATHARAVAAGGDISRKQLMRRARLPRLARVMQYQATD